MTHNINPAGPLASVTRRWVDAIAMSCPAEPGGYPSIKPKRMAAMRTFTAFSILALTSAALAVPAAADEKADIALVERELRAMDEAREIEKRAQKRAYAAVWKSSVGSKCLEHKRKYQDADKAFRQSGAFREYLGNKKIDYLEALKRISNEAKNYGEKMRKEQALEKELSRRKRAYNEANRSIKNLRSLWHEYEKLCHLWVKKMTVIFLRQEIRAADRKKLRTLKRELEKLGRKYERI